MRSFARLVAVVSAGLLATVSASEKSVDATPKNPGTKASGDKPGAKVNEKGGTPVDPNAPRKPITLPVEKGFPSYGLVIPYRNDGRLQMRFNIGVATKVDDIHVDMGDLQIETFNDDGEHEMSIVLPTSTIDLTTRVITARQAVTITRKDFELTGNTMIFKTGTKVGGLGGDVRMLIYNLGDEIGQTPVAPAPAPPIFPTPESKAR